MSHSIELNKRILNQKAIIKLMGLTIGSNKHNSQKNKKIIQVIGAIITLLTKNHIIKTEKKMMNKIIMKAEECLTKIKNRKQQLSKEAILPRDNSYKSRTIKKDTPKNTTIIRIMGTTKKNITNTRIHHIKIQGNHITKNTIKIIKTTIETIT